MTFADHAKTQQKGNHNYTDMCCYGFITLQCEDCEDKSTWKCLRFQDSREKCKEPRPCARIEKAEAEISDRDKGFHEISEQYRAEIKKLKDEISTYHRANNWQLRQIRRLEKLYETKFICSKIHDCLTCPDNINCIEGRKATSNAVTEAQKILDLLPALVTIRDHKENEYQINVYPKNDIDKLWERLRFTLSSEKTLKETEP